ncbi:hypothetical protein AURDEDRAFT_164245 [Auricularia subglabra TFB-10046 SS5]|nr:hypothetical protein AURDEDRAFT_164245 [Auricularia subglabra TFB-10046 SS5]
MESTCKVFLAPRSRAGEPDVVITRAPSGMLLAAVSCDCPRNGPCKRHNADELLRRARDHHKTVAPLMPCMFSMNPREGQANTPMSDVELHEPVPATSPYAPKPANVAVANPAYITPGKLFMLSYLPACTMGSSLAGDMGSFDLSRGPPMPVVFEGGLDFEFRMARPARIFKHRLGLLASDFNVALPSEATIDTVTLVDKGVMLYEGNTENLLGALETSLLERDKQEHVEIVLQGLQAELTSDGLPSVRATGS